MNGPVNKENQQSALSSPCMSPTRPYPQRPPSPLLNMPLSNKQSTINSPSTLTNANSNDNKLNNLQPKASSINMRQTKNRTSSNQSDDVISTLKF